MISNDAELSDNWERRVLCSDEGCIGVLGRDGFCTTCGKKGEAAAVGAAEHGATCADAPTTTPAVIARPDVAPAEDEGDFAKRELCSDESCLGLIGPNRTCKVCGAYKQ